MQNKLKPELVSFQKKEIIDKVKKQGSENKLGSWEKAFPEIGFSKRELKKLSPIELAAYVAYIVNPQAAMLSFAINHEDVGDIMGKIERRNVWEALIAHAFTYFDKDQKVSDETLLELFKYAAVQYWSERNRLPADGLDYEDAEEFISETRADYLLLISLYFKHQKVV